MSLAHDWASYCALCERLRHRNGDVDYRSRNFHTLGDWLPNNAWILEDITGRLKVSGQSPAEPFTHVVRPKVFVPREADEVTGVSWVFKGSDYRSPNKEARSDVYIPCERIGDVLPELRTGDIVLVIRGVDRNAGCDHMGIIAVDEDGTVWVIHSAPAQVRPDEFAKFARGYPWVSGFKFLRLPQDAQVRTEVELNRLAVTVTVSSAKDVDARVAALRTRRLAGR